MHSSKYTINQTGVHSPRPVTDPRKRSGVRSSVCCYDRGSVERSPGHPAVEPALLWSCEAALVTSERRQLCRTLREQKSSAHASYNNFQLCASSRRPRMPCGSIRQIRLADRIQSRCDSSHAIRSEPADTLARSQSGAPCPCAPGLSGC